MPRKSSRSNLSCRVHVISNKNSRAVKSERTSKASKIYHKRSSAISGAHKMSGKCEVVIHRTDGSIERWEKPK